MKNKILLFLFATFSLATLANLPPTTSKISGDSNAITTFNYEFPHFAGTHTGSKVVLDVLGISGGGTGSATQNFVDLTTAQTVAGNKTFSGTTTLSSLTGPLKGSSGVVSASAINLTSEVTGTLPVANGGTGSATQNFVDLSTTQSSIGGSKGFTNPIGVGAAASTTAGVNIATTLTGGNTQYGLLQNTTFGSGTTTAATGFWSRINTAAASFTLTDAFAFDLVNASKGAGSTITNLTGLMVRDQTQGTNNYGIQNQVSSGANKWGYYGSGSANNAFAGNTRFGSTSAPSATVDITGTLSVSTPIALASGGTGAATKSAAFDALSPMTTSGDIIYGGTSGTGTRLAKGTDGQRLTLEGGLPVWNDELLVEADSSSTSISGSGAITVLTWNNETYDPQGLFTPGTGSFVCNKTMTLRVTAAYLATAATSVTGGNVTQLRLRKNGTTVRNVGFFVAPSTTSQIKSFAGPPGIVSCVNTDVITTAVENPDTTFTGINTAPSTWITFERIK